MTFKEWVMKWDIGPGMNDQRLANRGAPEAKEQFKNYSGFDGQVGEGWVNKILDPLANDLIMMGWDRDLHQVKEKYGTLRFYIGVGNHEMDERISQAEHESEVTCEQCGEPGKLQGRGWYVTNCDKCYAEWQALKGQA
jgi:hypothetical protein